jgi:hypothetical protein
MLLNEILFPLTDMSILIEFIIYVLLIFFTIYNYKSLKIFELGMILMLISIIFFIYSMSQNIMILTPFLQLFFIVFELIIFTRIYKNRELNEG